MLTTLTIPHSTLGQLHSREQMKILLGGRDTEHYYVTVPQRPSLIRCMIKAILSWSHRRTART